LSGSVSEQQGSGRARLLPWIVQALAVGLFALVILGITLSLRRTLQEQMIARESEALNAVITLKLLEGENETAVTEAQTAMDLLDYVLETSRLSDVLGVRVYTPEGRAEIAFPGTLPEVTLPAEHLPALRRFQVVERYNPRATVASINAAAEGPDETTPVLHVWLPMRSPGRTEMLGIGEFILDAHALQLKLGRMDGYLLRHGLGIFALGAAVLVIGLHFAFSRLQSANSRLEEQTRKLQKAYEELTLNAKTSALGAVTAHLIHELKNPLSGLHSFVSSTPKSGDTEIWENAADSTRRMQGMIQEIVRILQEENSPASYDLTPEEIVRMVARKSAPSLREKGMRIEEIVTGEAQLPNRVANLVSLILQNLVDNAIQASPSGTTVTLFAAPKDGGICFQVRDQGPGIREDAQKTLFAPGRSSKSGGTGLGLAISKQLADKLEAELTLQNTSSDGSTFQLCVPARALAPNPAS